MKKIIYLICILLIVSSVSAQELQVVKESNPEIKLGDIIEIKIHISNPSQTEKEFSIKEILPKDIEVIDPTTFSTKRNDALEVSYYSWITLISPNSIKTITYKIKPLSLGEYSISSTKVIDNSNLNEIESNSITFKVNCVPDNKCDLKENSILCPEDCSKEISDGICIYKADGICDPDCDNEPDCEKSEFNIKTLLISFLVIIIIILLIWLLPKIFKKKEKFQVQGEKTEIKYVNIPKDSKEKDPLSGFKNNQ